MKVKAREMKNLRSWHTVWFVLILGLASCSGMKNGFPGLAGQPKSFQPPTLEAGSVSLVQPSPTPEPTIEILPVPTPQCSNLLTYLEDLTIPDGTVVHPGESLDKRWLIQNNGSCNWNENYRLKLISGPPLGISEEQALYPARGGTQAVIRILFTAPDEPGLQRSAWRAYSPDGEAFGDPIYIEISIETPAP
jgi:hypothetical protein